VIVLTLATVVLRSPLTVLTMLATPSSDHSPLPTDGSVGTVPDVVTARVGDGDDPATAPQGSPSSDVSDGRWGASSVRPGGLDILLEEFRGGWRVEGGTQEAAALAVIAAHAWADARSGWTGEAGAGAGLGPGTRARAIVTVEAVERPGALHAVVTLLVADSSDLYRIAVPIVFRAEGATVAGRPWMLPAPMATASDVTGNATGDPVLLEAARRALESIGIPGERLVALETTDGWPFIARLDDGTDGDPWLRWHVDRFVVSGLPLRTGGGSR
jgi:hypothetical protein